MKIVITGEKGYISSNLFSYLRENGEDAECVSFRNGADKINLSGVDVVVHCAAIVHKREKDYAEMYEQINHIEAVKLAQKAKKCGVKHFVFMSSMSVYGIKSGEIKADSVCAPVTLYGKSKLAAERDMQELSDDSFVVTAIRAPMVYGRACPGNFGTLKRFAAKSPIFPRVNNKRSMIYIGNLTELIYRVVVAGTGGVILPMDGEYINTSDMVKTIANGMGRKIYLSGLMGFIVQRIHFGVFEKVFGSLYYADEVALKCDRFAVKDAVEKSL